MRVLSLAHCELADTFGVPFAEALKRNRGLVKFSLNDNNLTSKTLSSLAYAMKENSGRLKEINLAKNNFTDKGGAKLGEAIQFN